MTTLNISFFGAGGGAQNSQGLGQGQQDVSGRQEQKGAQEGTFAPIFLLPIDGPNDGNGRLGGRQADQTPPDVLYLLLAQEQQQARNQQEQQLNPFLLLVGGPEQAGNQAANDQEQGGIPPILLLTEMQQGPQRDQGQGSQPMQLNLLM